MTLKAIDGLKSDDDLWNSIKWREVNQIVDCLQRRIVKAVKAKNKEKVRSLQRLLARSLAGRLKAVKRVTTNRGKRTPGVDKILLDTPGKKWQQAQRLNVTGYKSQPLKRTYVPKKNGKLRPLGIPVMHDRAEQSLEQLGLDPVPECTADSHSYGFRKKRSIHDAIGACYNALRRRGSAQWILEGDIKGCFDFIDHDWLLRHNRVFVTSASLPATAKYEVLGSLEVGKVWYGSSDNVLQSLADGARKLGVDAVVEVKTWHQPSGWSWAAPHGSGKAVKINEPACRFVKSWGRLKVNPCDYGQCKKQKEQKGDGFIKTTQIIWRNAVKEQLSLFHKPRFPATGKDLHAICRD